MDNPYMAPKSALTSMDADNTSGMGKEAVIPEGIKGWSWGAFFFNWLWAVFNKTWIGLLCFIPYVGFVMSFVLGAKGREWAWRNKRWDSVEHFNAVQRRWSLWALVFLVVAVVGIVAAIALPAYQNYVHAGRLDWPGNSCNLKIPEHFSFPCDNELNGAKFGLILRGKSVVVSQLSNQERIVLYAIHHAVLVGDSARPKACQCVL